MTRQEQLATERLAAGLWVAAATLYLGVERVTAAAFAPPYSYAHNYISDLGVPTCGVVFDGRAICSPLHALMNVEFVLQGLLFFAAAFAITRAISTPTRYVLLVCAALNGIGLGLIAIFPETTLTQAGGVPYHVVGAVLAIVFGNATALTSAWTFWELGLVHAHRWTSIALPILAVVALTMLSVTGGAGTHHAIPAGVWERISVYTITAWELLSAASVMARPRGDSRMAETLR